MENRKIVFNGSYWRNAFILDGTPYENGYFKVKLLLNEGYPETPPKGKNVYWCYCCWIGTIVERIYVSLIMNTIVGYFTTKIFHPNVASNGEICVNTLKKDWKAELGIAHVLLVRILSVRIIMETKGCVMYINSISFFR